MDRDCTHNLKSKFSIMCLRPLNKSNYVIDCTQNGKNNIGMKWKLTYSVLKYYQIKGKVLKISPQIKYIGWHSLIFQLEQFHRNWYRGVQKPRGECLSWTLNWMKIIFTQSESCVKVHKNMGYLKNVKVHIFEKIIYDFRNSDFFTFKGLKNIKCYFQFLNLKEKFLFFEEPLVFTRMNNFFIKTREGFSNPSCYE